MADDRFHGYGCQWAGVSGAQNPREYRFGQVTGEPHGFIEALVPWTLIFLGFCFVRPLAHALRPGQYAAASFAENFLVGTWFYVAVWFTVVTAVLHCFEGLRPYVGSFWNRFLLHWWTKPVLGMFLGLLLWWQVPEGWITTVTSSIDSFREWIVPLLEMAKRI